MSRRRYLSNKISTDVRVNQLAVEHGDFAALLYTWLVPHAEDDATMTGDPAEVLMVVLPGRRDKTPEDIATALAAMDALDLIVWEEGQIFFPPDSFYKHQPYVKQERRRSEHQRKVAKNGANLRTSPTSAQNAASFSHSHSVSHSPSPSISHSEKTLALAKPRARPRDELWDALTDEFGEPTNDSERGRRNKTLKLLRQSGATPQELRRRIEIYRAKWPDIDCTPTAIASNWSDLDRAPPATTPKRYADIGTWLDKQEAHGPS